MKSETDIQRELFNIKRMLAEMRTNSNIDSTETDMLYGAEQALSWVIGGFRSPTEVEEIIREAADMSFNSTKEMENK